MRLIDADELTKDFNTFTNSFVMTTDKMGNFVISCNAPTAYDIYKVVEELYMHSVEEKIPSCLTHRIIDVEEAIEVVKAGVKE